MAIMRRKEMPKMNIPILEDFHIERISHPHSVLINLKRMTIKKVIPLDDNKGGEFFLKFHEKTKYLEELDNVVWFSKELNEEEYKRMKAIIKEYKKWKKRMKKY